MIMRVIHQSIRGAIQEAEHFSVCNYETYNSSRYAERNTDRYAKRYKIKDTHLPSADGACVSPRILIEMYQQNNQSLPEVKALTSERLKKCRSRINQAERDGCLEQYLIDFTEAVRKAQQTPFLRGEGARGWRAGFYWFVANQVNIYKVLEGKYDGPATGSDKGGGNDNVTFFGGGFGQHDGQQPATAGRTSRSDLHPSAVSQSVLFWDDIDKLKPTDFKTEVLFELWMRCIATSTD